MENYQLAAFDMDGTLLNSEKEITEKSMEMIEKAIAAGKKIVLSTGRGPAELLDYEDLMEKIRYANCTSGALVYDWQEKKEICSTPLMPDEIKVLMGIAKEEDTMVHFLSKGSFVQKSAWERMDHYNMGIYKDMFDRVAEKVEDIREFYEARPFPVEKMNIYHTSVESRDRTERRIREAGLGVAMAHSEISSLEISAEGVDKGTGLRQLCEYLQIPIEQSIAVGDADNDLGALRCAGLAVAMGNANEKVKQIADVIVADCDHEGCAQVIEQYLL